MKKTLSFALSTVALCFLMSSCGGNTAAKDKETTTATTVINKSIGAAFGTMISLNVGQSGIKGDMLIEAKVIEAFNAQLANKALLTAEITNNIIQQQMETIAKGNVVPLSEEQKANFSQAVGTLLGDNHKAIPNREAINPSDFILSFCKGINGQPVMSPEEAQKMLNANQPANGAGQGQQAELEKAGKEFLAQNKEKKGVITTASGLQYEVLTAGKGAKPTIDSKVEVHYHGTLIDGTVFDSSVERKETISFPLSGVIQGWQEGVQLMSKGAKYRFYIPHELGYGGRPSGKIPPFSTLIFDVELFNIQ
jgi:FKBP-type peptidyl-prolyl cis-trans isomerase